MAWAWATTALTSPERRWKEWPTALPTCGMPCTARPCPMRRDPRRPIGQGVRLTGGITRTPLWVQILADMLGVPLMASGGRRHLGDGRGAAGHARAGSDRGRPDRSHRGTGPDLHALIPRRHQFYRQHHREYRALRRGMTAMGETLDNLKESYLMNLQESRQIYDFTGKTFVVTGGDGRFGRRSSTVLSPSVDANVVVLDRRGARGRPGRLRVASVAAGPRPSRATC